MTNTKNKYLCMTMKKIFILSLFFYSMSAISTQGIELTSVEITPLMDKIKSAKLAFIEEIEECPHLRKKNCCSLCAQFIPYLCYRRISFRKEYLYEQLKEKKECLEQMESMAAYKYAALLSTECQLDTLCTDDAIEKVVDLLDQVILDAENSGDPEAFLKEKFSKTLLNISPSDKEQGAQENESQPLIYEYESNV